MQAATSNKNISMALRVICYLLLFEYLLFIISGASFSYLQGNGFFSIEVDPVSWGFYLLGVPQFITSHPWASVSLDIITVTLLILFSRNPFNNKIAIPLFLLLLLFYVTLMGHLAHHNYQFGYCLLLLPFMFKETINRNFAYDAVRYFALFFYFSAGLLKITGNSWADPAHFSHLVSGQFTPYYLEHNTGFRTMVNLYFSGLPKPGYVLFLLSIILEIAALIGFFTKKFDTWLCVFILLFHFGNWLLMDIGPWGQVAFVCFVFSRQKFAD
ncbi:MAG: hypothetical protein JST02_04570 [Bacteroidetes bacterium]|nr:hypothetical protein [Bacteroidota bacterium]